jgi:protocatechuate 3,4-dioxygenase alpha subunit
MTSSSQTAGPYVHIGFAKLYRSEIVPAGVPGERIAVSGRMIDGDGKPMTDAIVEIWQADAQGRYAHPEGGAQAAFNGFGRVPTDRDGMFRFNSIKPGRVPAANGALQAPHLAIAIFSRGLLKQLQTRMYFPDDPANAEDPVLKLVPAERRATLIARRSGSELTWNIVVQGGAETVFFDY